MVLTDMSKLDEMIEKQKERLVDKPEQSMQAPPMGAFPWTQKMADAFETEIMKSEKCRACNWMNTGQKIVMMNRIQIMRENLPIISIICRQCGSVYVPKWCRKIMLQAIEEENRILKARQIDQKTAEMQKAAQEVAQEAAQEE